MEPLEIRCNPSAIDPLAFAEPAEPSQNYGGMTDITYTVTVTDTQSAAAPVDRQGGLPNVPVVDLQLSPKFEVLGAAGAGTVSGDATRTGTHYFDGRFLRSDDLISEPARIDQQLGTTAFKVIVDPTPADQTVGVDGQGYLLGGDGRDTFERATHELGHTLGFRHEHTRPTSDAPAAGDVNDDGVDDIITAATVNGHVKVFDGNSGAEIRSFLAFPGFTGGVSVASGYNVPVDPSDPAGSVYSHPDLYKNIGINQSELESVIEDLARDVAAATYAGQSVRIRIEAADASTASQAVGGLGNDWIVGGTGQDPRNAGAPSGKLYVATNVGVFVNVDGRDVLLGGGGEDLLIGGSLQHAQIGAGLDILIANTGDDRLGATFDQQGRLLIGTDGGIWRSGSVADDDLTCCLRTCLQIA